MKGIKRYFLDTNIFLRVIANDDPKKTRECEAVMELIRDGKIHALTASIVAAEIVWTALSYYKIPKPEVVKLLNALLSSKHLRIRDNTNMLVALELYEKHAVKFIDALIASDPLLVGGRMAIVSYDKDFDRLGCQRIEPSEIVS